MTTCPTEQLQQRSSGRESRKLFLPIFLSSPLPAFFLFLLLPILGGTIPSKAQTETTTFDIRLIPALEWGVPTGIEREPGLVNTGDLQSPGTGTSQQISWLVGIEIGQILPLRGEFGLGGGLHINRSSGSFISDSYTRNGPAVNATGDTPSADYRFRIDLNEWRLEGELFGVFGIGNRLAIGAGGWLGYRLGGDIRQEESILGPAGVTFTDGPDSLIRVLAEGEKIVGYPLRFGGRTGLRWHAGNLFGLRIEPELSTRFDAQSLFQDGLGINAFSGRIGLGIVPVDRRRTISLSDSIISPPALLSAGVQLRAIRSSSTLNDIRRSAEGSDSIILRRQLVTRHRYIPFPFRLYVPAILAEERRLPDRAAADTFRIESLSTLPPQDLLEEGLNVLGQRMREQPESRIRLTGRRAGEAGDYLREIWGIDPGRIEVTETAEGERSALPPDSVLLQSDSPSLLAPLFQRWIVEEFRDPRIAVQTQIIAEAGLRRWEIRLRQGETLLAEYRSDSGDREEIGLQLGDLYDRTSHLPIEAELIVEDERGLRDTAYGRLSLQTDPAPAAEITLREYWLPLHRPDELSREVEDLLLDHLVEKTTGGAKIEIHLVEETNGATGKTDSSHRTTPEELTARLLKRFDEKGKRVGSITYGRTDEEGIGEPAVRIRVIEP